MSGPRIHGPRTTGGTLTAEGIIPHIRVELDHVAFEAPVRVLPSSHKEPLSRPERDAEGRLLYALPGGAVAVATQ